MSAKIAVIYYSATGSVHQLALAVTEGAEKAGAEVRLRRVAETAPDAAIDSRPEWRAHVDATKDDVQVATLDDLRWADAYAFGAPTRFGNIAAQFKQFLDSAGEMWMAGELGGQPVTGFTSANSIQGGNESTLLALYNTMYHWGAIIVPPGYTDPSVTAAYGNPYGAAHPGSTGAPAEETLAVARYQGRRLATITGQLLAGQMS